MENSAHALRSEWGLSGFGLGDWARIVSSGVPGSPGWDKLGPGGAPISSAMQTHMSDATTADRKRWTAFAIAALRSGKYDMSYYPGDNQGQGPTVTHPDSNFWKATPQHRADHDQFVAEANGYKWENHTSGSFNPIKAIASAVNAVEKIPVVGNVVHIAGEVYSAPFKIASNIVSGERLDRVALGALKDQIKIVKDVAPYAQTVVSMVPGVGTGVAAAIGAGAALAEGQSITAAAKAAIRGALPGGAVAAAAFDLATKAASGENVVKAALESARNLIPDPNAQKAFDIGVAVVTGEKLQTALANGLASLAPGQLQTILEVGQKALASTPGLADAIKNVAPGGATEGFNLAAGLLSHAGVNEASLSAVRSKLPPEVVQGFDAALKTQVPHIAWLANVVSKPVTAAAPAPKPPQLPPPKVAAAPKPPQSPVKPPQMPSIQRPVPVAAPKVTAAASVATPTRAPSQYGPYPKQTGAVSGAPALAPYGMLSGPPPTCRALGAPITDMGHGMRIAGMAAVHGSGGRPRMVHGPDGNDYHFSIKDGTLIARQCHT